MTNVSSAEHCEERKTTLKMKPHQSTTFRHGRLGMGRLVAATIATGLLGTWTFMRCDFLGTRDKKFSFQFFFF